MFSLAKCTKLGFGRGVFRGLPGVLNSNQYQVATFATVPTPIRQPEIKQVKVSVFKFTVLFARKNSIPFFQFHSFAYTFYFVFFLSFFI